MSYAATLISPALGATAATCKMTFAYTHLYPLGSKAVLSINLYHRRLGFIPITRKVLFTITTPCNWQNYTVHIGQLPAGYQIEIAGDSNLYTQLGPYIDMSIDNIKFVDCDPSVQLPGGNLTCDFENGMCGWTDLNLGSTNRIDWVRI